MTMAMTMATMMCAMFMVKNDAAEMIDYAGNAGDRVSHRCLACARHPVEQLPKRETVVACGRRVGAHLPPPMADGLDRATEGRRMLERNGLVCMTSVAKGELIKYTALRTDIWIASGCCVQIM